MTAHNTVQQYPRYLLDYEKTEIFEYQTVYYLNLEKERKSPYIQTPNDSNNYGFDNDRNEYVCSPKDHIAYRYEIKRQIGKGSFG